MRCCNVVSRNCAQANVPGGPMSFENAKANLREFGKELNLEGLVFDENNTCILGIDNAFSLHITYEPNSDRLYLYSPILDGLPKDDKIRFKALREAFGRFDARRPNGRRRNRSRSERRADILCTAFSIWGLALMQTLCAGLPLYSWRRLKSGVKWLGKSALAKSRGRSNSPFRNRRRRPRK